MKARVKATGEIVEVTRIIDRYVMTHHPHTITFEKDELDFDIEDNPDYWTHLEHQYAGMAMQGIVNTFNNRYRDSCALRPNITRDQSEILLKESARATAEVCYYFAHALVEKLKSE